jgi:hypothetical protein
MKVSEQGLNIGRAVLWYHLVCGWYRGTWQLFVMLPAALLVLWVQIRLRVYQFIILNNNL